MSEQYARYGGYNLNTLLYIIATQKDNKITIKENKLQKCWQDIKSDNIITKGKEIE